MTEFENSPPAREPAVRMPPVVWGAIVLMGIIHAVRVYLLDEASDDWLLYHFAFIPVRYVFPISEQDFGWLAGPVTSSLLHADWLHFAFNSFWLAAFATPLAERWGAIRFAGFWIAAAVASAFVYAAAISFTDSYLIGASGVVSAVTGAACRFALPIRRGRDPSYFRHAPRLGMIEALRQPSVAVFIGAWAFSNALVVFGVGMPEGEAYNIAWQAHVGGLLFGYLAFGLFDYGARRSDVA
ncbi:rhomboid family intramembrane serine protease [Rhizobium sp. FKL33]|uniref:rhomboid family intramembrane serine protease n=1 Tax=Rhizobium sp. FKL33 TaxID=2562307 RepID=UPI0010BF94E4|nr:rhomboid family intramembrane serine protease [Rhizobium sp. FKL33]